MTSGLVFNIQRYSLHDGPGIRTTVFLKGCPLRCLWCHNPEGISAGREIIVIKTRCIACGKCFKVCPAVANKSGSNTWAGSKKTGVNLEEVSDCILCGECVKSCPTQARQIVGKEFTPLQLAHEVLKDRMFFEESEGGVTFSGGEPLSQAEFLVETMVELKKHDIHIAVDTCGFAPHSIVKKTAKLVDLFLFDIKFISPGKHRKFTGATNELIIENLAILNETHQNIWIRIPVVPGANTDNGEIDAIGKFLKPFKSVRQINLLPYHGTWTHKAKWAGEKVGFSEFAKPSIEQLELIKSRLSFLNIPVKIGG